MTACDESRVEWADLPASPGSNYRVAVKIYQDNDSVAQPFKLGVRSSKGIDDVVQILSAEQCKDVEVFQGERSITIFYDTLILDHFSGDDHGLAVPRVSLCDNAVPACQERRRAYLKRGIRGNPVCTLR
jgi:hypothetical protein